jgi:hypothetical protein
MRKRKPENNNKLICGVARRASKEKKVIKFKRKINLHISLCLSLVAKIKALGRKGKKNSKDSFET